MYRLAASSDHRPDAFENALGESDCRGKQPMNLTHEQELIFQTAGFPKEMTTSSLSCCCSRLQILRSVDPHIPGRCAANLAVRLPELPSKSILKNTEWERKTNQVLEINFFFQF